MAEFKSILTGTAKRLRSHGFKRATEGRFVRADNDVAQVIQLQRARAGDSLVVNYGVAVRELFDGDDWPNLYHTECQWGGRCTDDTGVEIWVPLAETEAWILTTIERLLESQALPGLEQYGDRSALVSLWKSGQSPSLTEAQRLAYLAILSFRDGEREDALNYVRALEDLTADGCGLGLLRQAKAVVGE